MLKNKPFIDLDRLYLFQVFYFSSLINFRIMKKYFTFIIFMFFVPLLMSAQSDRMLLAEGFTSTTCGPCASQNPAFDALLHANTDKITSIKYHMSWPAPGNDPMYLHNTVDNNARRTYYGVNAVPHVVIGGNVHTGTPNTVNQAAINNWASAPSPLDIVMQHRISDNQDSVFVVMLIKANQAVTGTLVAHIAVIEKEIHFTSAPGPNGEKDFYNVMKAMIPTRNGTAIANLQQGEYVIVEASWKLANVYNLDQIAAVGFVQNNLNKEVLQAANSTADPIQPFFANDAAVQRIVNGTSVNCSGTMQPSAKISNYGSAPMTSATINFSVNGSLLTSVEWTGNLGFLESAMVETGMLEFDLLEENNLTVEIVSINGNQDDYPANNSFDMPFVMSPDVPQTPSLFILLDNNPEQVTWELKNSNGDIVDAGGPYPTPNGIISVPLQISSVGCYEFTIYDAGGNGLCCSSGVGYYAVLAGGSTPLFTGQDFGTHERNELYYGYVGVNEQANAFSVNLQPNPAKEVATIQLSLSADSEAFIGVTDISGREVLEIQKHHLLSGSHQLPLDIAQLKPGLYLVNIEINGQSIIKKLMVE